VPTRRIYLDNAATSWPKPEAVYSAVDNYQRHVGAAAGRGSYSQSVEVGRLVEAARRGAARLLGGASSQHLIFTANCTDALNLAVQGLLKAGDHAVTTVVEHNSLLRPLRNLEDAGHISVSRVGCNGRGVVDPDEIRRALTPATRLIALSHASNVTGALQPVEAVAQIARQHGARLLVDAAQTAGHMPVDAGRLNADLLATSAHKGLLGPLGLGILLIAPGVEQELAPTRQGGTGTHSEEDRQPLEVPWKYEAGNLNVPAIAGLHAAIEFLECRGLESLAAHGRHLAGRLIAELVELRGVKVHGPPSVDERVGLVSISLDGYDPQEVAAVLDASHRVQVRAGLHCAPLMHRALGTLDQGGTVRLSCGPFNTEDDVHQAATAIRDLVST
jgi:cysteine desulfurase family protein